MNLSKTKIAVLMGGPGSERQVSLASGNAVLKALLSIDLDAVAVDVTSAEINLPEDIGLCFNLIHGTFGEDGQLQKILDEKGIPYTGARAESSRIAFDKNLAKQAFIAAGVPTPKSEIIDCTNGPVLPSSRHHLWSNHLARAPQWVLKLSKPWNKRKPRSQKPPGTRKTS